MDEVNVLKESVRAAVQTLYAPATDASSRKAASRWLEAFQNSLPAWNISLDILCSTVDGDFEVRQQMSFIAAQTLKHKLALDYAQLERGQGGPLLDALWSLIFRNESSHVQARSISNQLLLAMATLLMQQLLEGLGTEESMRRIHELISHAANYSTINNNRNFVCKAWQLLAILPEQYDVLVRRRVWVGGSDGDAADWAMTQAGIQVMSLIAETLHPSSNQNSQSVDNVVLWECAVAWAKHSGTGRATLTTATTDSSSPNVGHVLLQSAFRAVITSDAEDEGVARAAGEFVSEAIFYWADAQGADSGQQQEQRLSFLKQFLGEGVKAGILPLLRAKSSRNADGEEEGGDAQITSLVGILCDLGVAFIDDLVQMVETDLVNALIEAILLAASQSVHLADLTLAFWDSLGEALSRLHPDLLCNTSGDGISTAPPYVLKQALEQWFSLVVSKLLVYPETLRTKQQILGRLDAEESGEKSEFRETRNRLGDSLRDAMLVLGSSQCLQLLVQSHPVLIGQQSSPSVNSNAEGWAWSMEAALFTLRLLLPQVDRRESELMPLILSNLLSQSNNSQYAQIPLIQKGVAYVLGYCSEWLTYHAEFLGAALRLLISFINDANVDDNGGVVEAAAYAVQWLCSGCSQLIVRLDSGQFLQHTLLPWYDNVLRLGNTAGKIPLKPCVLALTEGIGCLMAGLQLHEYDSHESLWRHSLLPSLTAYVIDTSNSDALGGLSKEDASAELATALLKPFSSPTSSDNQQQLPSSHPLTTFVLEEFLAKGNVIRDARESSVQLLYTLAYAVLPDPALLSHIVLLATRVQQHDSSFAMCYVVRAVARKMKVASSEAMSFFEIATQQVLASLNITWQSGSSSSVHIDNATNASYDDYLALTVTLLTELHQPHDNNANNALFVDTLQRAGVQVALRVLAAPYSSPSERTQALVCLRVARQKLHQEISNEAVQLLTAAFPLLPPDLLSDFTSTLISNNTIGEQEETNRNSNNGLLEGFLRTLLGNASYFPSVNESHSLYTQGMALMAGLPGKKRDLRHFVRQLWECHQRRRTISTDTA